MTIRDEDRLLAVLKLVAFPIQHIIEETRHGMKIATSCPVTYYQMRRIDTILKDNCRDVWDMENVNQLESNSYLKITYIFPDQLDDVESP